MRVLICDQESEMLETIARSFEVDVATSKATCIDLMRANPFDVLVASERLSDGSGLELLSHVATRWPDTLRVLVIEPARLKVLRGKLAPFKLDATLKYPIDEDELEAVLNRLHERLADAAEYVDDDEEDVPGPPPAPAAVRTPVRAPTAASAPPSIKVQKVQLSQQPARASSPATSGRKVGISAPDGAGASKSGAVATSSRAVPTAAARAGSDRTAAPKAGAGAAAKGTSGPKSGRNSSPLGAPAPGGNPAPVKRRLGNYTPLGSPEDDQLRIVEREFDHHAAPLASRAIRTREEASRPRTPGEKAKLLAAHVGNTLKRLLKR